MLCCLQAFEGVLHYIKSCQFVNIWFVVRSKYAEFFQYLLARWSIQWILIKLIAKMQNLIITFWLTKKSEPSIVWIDSLLICKVFSNYSLFFVIQRVVRHFLLEFLVFILQLLYLVKKHRFLNHVFLNFSVTQKHAFIVENSSCFPWSVGYTVFDLVLDVLLDFNF